LDKGNISLEEWVVVVGKQQNV